VAADEALYVFTGRGQGLRVDPKTGEAKPEMVLRGRPVAEPLLYETSLVRDRKFLLVLTTAGLECFDLSSGRPKFSAEVKRLLNVCQPAPNLAYYGNALFFGWYDACLYSVDFVSGSVAWNSSADVPSFMYVHATRENALAVSPSGILTAFSLKDGSRIGRRDLSASYQAAPAAIGDILALASTDGLVTAISSDLRPKWSLNVEGRVECPLAADSENFYVATQTGKVRAISRTGQALWTLQVEGEPLRLLPAANRLFIYTREGTLHSTRIADKQ
jgi:outer membrane protein assembly factor BamB